MPQIDLTRRPSRHEDLGRWYATALAEQESSGLSVTDFAEELGVTAATLYCWRRRLAAEDNEDRRPASSLKGLVEVTVDRRDPPGNIEPFVVHLGGERSIEVPRTFDDGDLHRLVTVLESC
ncbi:MAG: transposase [bacterium]|nr:transposase [bacterium]